MRNQSKPNHKEGQSESRSQRLNPVNCHPHAEIRHRIAWWLRLTSLSTPSNQTNEFFTRQEKQVYFRWLTAKFKTNKAENNSLFKAIDEVQKRPTRERKAASQERKKENMPDIPIEIHVGPMPLHDHRQDHGQALEIRPGYGPAFK